MRKRLLACMCMLMACILAVSNPGHLFATSIQEEENKKDELENELKNVQNKIDELEQYKSDEQEYIARLDTELTNITDQIYDYQQQAVDKKAEIKAKKKEIKAAKAEIDAQYADMKLRIQYMYENGDTMYEEMILSSTSISDFLSRAEYISDITAYDRSMLKKLQNSKKKLDKQKAKLVQQEAELERLIEQTENKQAGMQQMINAKQEIINEYDDTISNKEEAAKALKEDIEAQELLIAELKELERKRKEEEERRRQEALKNQQNPDLPTYDGGVFKWPLPGYTYISSEFGYRSDPFTGQQAYHNGLDIPAPEGTPIVAAYDGEVVWAYHSASAGNWIGIDHGDGITTIYMHASRLLVSAGQKVSAGQTIALVGTTGRSTGNHLHFTVRVNGMDVNPHNYVG